MSGLKAELAPTNRLNPSLVVLVLGGFQEAPSSPGTMERPQNSENPFYFLPRLENTNFHK